MYRKSKKRSQKGLEQAGSFSELGLVGPKSEKLTLAKDLFANDLKGKGGVHGGKTQVVTRDVSQLTYKIAKLWGSPTGTVEKHEVDQELHYEGGPQFASNFTADLMLINLKDEISVILSNASIDVRFTCQRCLEDFVQTIEIDGVEREFLWESQQDIENLYDVFFIDQKNMVVDLGEMVRQEIILHFPFIPVCFESCKGLCQYCRKNKNKSSCKCKDPVEAETEDHKPFKDLKKLIKKPKK